MKWTTKDKQSFLSLFNYSSTFDLSQIANENFDIVSSDDLIAKGCDKHIANIIISQWRSECSRSNDATESLKVIQNNLVSYQYHLIFSNYL